MNQTISNLKSILTSLATIFSNLFRKVGYINSSLLDTVRTIVIFGSSAVVGLAIFIYVVILSFTLPQSNEELA